MVSDVETLQSVINRAGGKTPRALDNGISIFRNKKYFDFHQLQDTSIVTSQINFNDKTADLNKIRVAWRNEKLTIMPGDSIVVKEKPGVVNIIGEVYNPGLIEFVESKSLDYYLDAVGGLAPNGNKKGIIIINPNGVVSPVKRFRRETIDDGSTIVVNQKLL